MSCFLKKKSNYFTDEKVANARANCTRFEWAKQMKCDVIEEADQYLVFGFEYIRNLITPQTLPRSFAVNATGSPITGSKLTEEYGNYGWEANPFKEPWKIKDPSSGYIFPTNDFKSYYESGLDSQGVFHRDLANDSFLRNTLYPEKGEKWGVDDGYGWVDEASNRWCFIAYYNHWHVWFAQEFLKISKSDMTKIENVLDCENIQGVALRILITLRDAFLYSGQHKYAHAGIILLDRIADVYPDMDSSVYTWEDGYRNSHGFTGKGKVIGSIWETLLARKLLTAYDAFFPAVDDAEVREYLQKSSKQIRRHLEEGIVLQIYPAVKMGQIRGNFSMHQSTLAMAAVVLGDTSITKDWIDWIFKSGGRLETDSGLRITGGNVAAALVNDVDRDGFGNESSPHYNALWLQHSQDVALALQHVTELPESNLFKHVKFKKLFDSRHPLIMARQYTPAIGDSEKFGNPFIAGTVAEHMLAFEQYEEPIYAQFAFLLNGNTLNGLHGNIFSADPEKIKRKVAKAIEQHGAIRFQSMNLTGYGFAALRSEGAEMEGNPRGIWMYYGRNTGHGHRDTLNLGMYSFGLDLMPDNGYPERPDNSAPRSEWVNNTMSHNTVTVDQSKQSSSWVGFPLHFGGSQTVQFMDVEASHVYPQTTLYRRSVVYIQVDPVNSYTIDFFRVKGGSDHHYSFHAAEGEINTEGLQLVKQDRGTYTGPEQAYGERLSVGPPKSYMGSGFHHLYNVYRDENPADQFSVDWTIKDTWGILKEVDKGRIHLRMTMLGKMNHVAVTDGKPPQKPGNPKSIKYIIANREDRRDSLESQFVALIEPYRDQRYIRSIRRIELYRNGSIINDEDSAAVRVEHENGRIDYIIHSIRSDDIYQVGDIFKFQGQLGMYSEMNGQPVYAYMQDGSLLQAGDHCFLEGPARMTGKVIDFTKEMSFSNHIEVSFDHEFKAIDALVGEYIYIQNDNERNAVYKIKGIKKCNERTYKLDIGDITLIQKYKNDNNFSEGYVFDINKRDSFYIPLSYEWKGE